MGRELDPGNGASHVYIGYFAGTVAGASVSGHGVQYLLALPVPRPSGSSPM